VADAAWVRVSSKVAATKGCRGPLPQRQYHPESDQKTKLSPV